MRRPLTTESWMEDALCAQVDPELFFAEKSDWASTVRAKIICRRCPVTDTCLAFALRNGEGFGVWGGTTPKQRQALRARGLAS